MTGSRALDGGDLVPVMQAPTPALTRGTQGTRHMRPTEGR